MNINNNVIYDKEKNIVESNIIFKNYLISINPDGDCLFASALRGLLEKMKISNSNPFSFLDMNEAKINMLLELENLSDNSYFRGDEGTIYETENSFEKDIVNKFKLASGKFREYVYSIILKFINLAEDSLLFSFFNFGRLLEIFEFAPKVLGPNHHLFSSLDSHLKSNENSYNALTNYLVDNYGNFDNGDESKKEYLRSLLKEYYTIMKSPPRYSNEYGGKYTLPQYYGSSLELEIISCIYGVSFYRFHNIDKVNARDIIKLELGDSVNDAEINKFSEIYINENLQFSTEFTGFPKTYNFPIYLHYNGNHYNFIKNRVDEIKKVNNLLKQSFSDYEVVLKNEKEPDYGFSSGSDVYGLIQQISRSTLDYSNESTNLNDKEQDNKSEPVKDQKSRKTIYNETHSAYELVKKIKENLLKFENDKQFLTIINENYYLSLEDFINFYIRNNVANHDDLIILNEDVNKLKIILDILKEVEINNFKNEITSKIKKLGSILEKSLKDIKILFGIDFLFKEFKTNGYYNEFIKICDINKSKLTEYYFKEFRI
tara:strand:+ start:5106 stop:6737 length:1632 start_codon:yes stop_codon:yes gene_type:complete